MFGFPPPACFQISTSVMATLYFDPRNVRLVLPKDEAAVMSHAMGPKVVICSTTRVVVRFHRERRVLSCS